MSGAFGPVGLELSKEVGVEKWGWGLWRGLEDGAAEGRELRACVAEGEALP